MFVKTHSESQYIMQCSNLGPRFGTPIWDRDLEPRFWTPNWDPDFGPRFWTPIWGVIWDPDLGPQFGTPIFDLEVLFYSP
jgi:hypothetical protein